MRTTLSIDDHLLAAAKHRARERGQTLGQVVDGALRRELSTPDAAAPVALPTFRGSGGLRHGIDSTSTRALLEALDDGVPPESLR